MADYEIPPFCGDTCVPFDQTFIDEICKIATEALKIRCGVEDWASGTSKNIVIGSDNNFYIANTSGNPSTTDPVGSSDGHWYGPYCSIAEALGLFAPVLQGSDVEPSPDCENSEKTLELSNSYVENAGFDTYTQLPDNIDQIEYAQPWVRFTQGTPDYFHEDGYNVSGLIDDSPDGGGFAGVLFNAVTATTPNYHEYISQDLANVIPQGTSVLVKMLAGGGVIADTSGDRDLVLYGLPSTVTTPVIGEGHIMSLSTGAVELSRHKMTVAGNNWEEAIMSFTAPFDITTIVIGGESSEAPTSPALSGAKYLLVDRILIAPDSDFLCPDISSMLVATVSFSDEEQSMIDKTTSDAMGSAE